jgi:hypothetical protein
VRSRHVAQVCQENAITPENVDAFTQELLRRYI